MHIGGRHGKTEREIETEKALVLRRAVMILDAVLDGVFTSRHRPYIRRILVDALYCRVHTVGPPGWIQVVGPPDWIHIMCPPGWILIIGLPYWIDIVGPPDWTHIAGPSGWIHIVGLSGCIYIVGLPGGSLLWVRLDGMDPHKYP